MNGAAPPEAVRLKKPSWKDPRLLVGILLVLASIGGVVALVGSADQTTEVYAAKDAISVGEALTGDSLAKVRVRLGDVEGQYITVASGLPDNVVALQRVGKDQLLPRESLGHADGLDRKPVSITVREGLPEQALAGTRVDVWVALPDAGIGFSEPVLLLAGAEISQITPGSSTLGASKSTELMVLVADAQMPALLNAQANDAKIAVVWNPGGRS